jgi:hypothetical protein
MIWGTCSRTVVPGQPGVTVSVPPSISARSRMPVRPWPGVNRPAAASPSSRMTMSRSGALLEVLSEDYVRTARA